MSADSEYKIEVFIEIAKNGHIKYEYDKDKKALVCDRVLHTPFKYHFNYGFVPNTLSEDGDPIDVVVLIDDELIPGCYINCKIIGVLETSDDKGDDPKLIAFPTKKVAPGYELYQDITDISETTRRKIKYFFEHYKDLENKKVCVGDFKGREEAIKIYEESIKGYKKSN
jgi:inorganic pyrophosphatase